MNDLELGKYIRDAVEGFVEPEDGEEPEALSIELSRSIVVWITYGGPNVWIEIPIDHGNAVIHGAWGSQRAEYALSHDEERSVLEALGIYDIEEYARYIGTN